MTSADGDTVAANPFAPPKADVADVLPGGAVAPALWNPNAAANWSLLFSPVFGAFLHMKNWEALGEPNKASASGRWAAIALVVFVVLALAGAFLPERPMDGISRAVAIGLLFGWYFASARQQTAYVKARFGKDYPPRLAEALVPGRARLARLRRGARPARLRDRPRARRQVSPGRGGGFVGKEDPLPEVRLPASRGRPRAVARAHERLTRGAGARVRAGRVHAMSLASTAGSLP